MELTAAMAADTDALQVATFIPYDPTSGTPTKWWAFMCKMTWSNTDLKFTPNWAVYDHQTTMISHATSALDTSD